MTAAAAPKIITQVGLQLADSHSEKTRLRGIRLLRSIGHEESMRLFCYRRMSVMTDLFSAMLSLVNPIEPDRNRVTYYRVTGKLFDSMPPPKTWRSSEEFSGDFDWDSAQGSDVIVKKLKGLELDFSRIDGSLDPHASLGYLEWIMVFRNNSFMEREARTEILLPPGGVVSRLSLWVFGQPQEAAFAIRGKTREAYQAVVRQRRDPVLVTTRGTDRILVQCFPVPPNHGEMKIRIGITFPLLMEKKEEAILRLPYIAERNYTISDSLMHSVWIESKTPFLEPLKFLQSENPEKELYTVRGAISDIQLADFSGAIRVARSSAIFNAWTLDTFDSRHPLIIQTLSEDMIQVPQMVILVVDASASMKPHMSAIDHWIGELPERIEVGLVLAGDTVEFVASGSQTRRQLSTFLSQTRFEGGMDNVPALMKAWDLASAKESSAIVWIHGAQAIILKAPEELRQRLERRPNGPLLFDIQATPAPNRVIQALDGITTVQTPPRIGELESDLNHIAALWKHEIPYLSLHREQILDSISPEFKQGKETSGHLARLWAKDMIAKLSMQRVPATEEASRYAIQYQLVTPVSGAVVLENQQQYKQAGLEPVQPGTVPIIPEPEFWILIGLVFCFLLWEVMKRKKQVRCPR